MSVEQTLGQKFKNAVKQLQMHHTRNMIETDEPILKDEELDSIWEYIKTTYQFRKGYHNLAHIERSINQLYQVEHKMSERACDILTVAIFFHDLVQGEEHDEIESGYIFVKILGDFIQPGAALRIMSCIMATDHSTNKYNGLTTLTEYMRDIDLSVLGTRQDIYRTCYAEQIEQEAYDFGYDQMQFSIERLEFLEMMLRKGFLFHTMVFGNKYEWQAKQNLLAEKKRLEDYIESNSF